MRSDHGLSNRAFFTGAKFTVYVEGGGGNDGASSLDAVFWSDIFKWLRPDIAITVVVSGGKPEVEKIARKVSNGDIDNTIVALDADFDEILGEKIDHPYIIYTYGYSIENDIFCFKSLQDGIHRILNYKDLSEEKLVQIYAHVRDTAREILPWVNFDFRLRIRNSSIFAAEKPGRFISTVSNGGKIIIQINELKKIYKKQIKEVDKKFRSKKPPASIVSTQSYLHGHTHQLLYRYLFSFAIKTLGAKVPVTDELITHLMLPIFCQNLSYSDAPIYLFYRNQLYNL